jgi:hypothetical protein
MDPADTPARGEENLFVQMMSMPDPEDTGSTQLLSGGANLSWVVKQALGSWVESSVLAGDMSQVQVEITLGYPNSGSLAPIHDACKPPLLL